MEAFHPLSCNFWFFSPFLHPVYLHLLKKTCNLHRCQISQPPGSRYSNMKLMNILLSFQASVLNQGLCSAKDLKVYCSLTKAAIIPINSYQMSFKVQVLHHVHSDYGMLTNWMFTLYLFCVFHTLHNVFQHLQTVVLILSFVPCTTLLLSYFQINRQFQSMKIMGHSVTRLFLLDSVLFNINFFLFQTYATLIPK